MQRFQVPSHSQALTPTHRSLQPVASIAVQSPHQDRISGEQPHLSKVDKPTFQLNHLVVFFLSDVIWSYW